MKNHQRYASALQAALIGLLLQSACDTPVSPKEWKPGDDFIIFSRTFHLNYSSSGRAVQQTTDGGFIVAGFTYLTSVQNEGLAWLLKTDGNGVEEWSQTFGETGFSRFHAVQQTTDGGFIANGFEGQTATEQETWLFKTDDRGVEEWSKTYGPGSTRHSSYLPQSADGGYFIFDMVADSIKGSNDFGLTKTDVNGAVIWHEHYGRSTLVHVPHSAQEVDGGGYVIVGRATTFIIGATDVILMRISAEGDSLWSRTFGGFDHDAGYSVQQTVDGGYIIGGFTLSSNQGDAFLIKTDASGMEEWSQTFGGSEFDQVFSVRGTRDGGYILVGTQAGKLWIAKTDPLGDIEGEVVLDDSGFSEGFSIEQTTDGGYIITGYLCPSTSATECELWLIRTGPIGNG